MIIYPALDLKNGKCIRLYQGDYARETIYSSDPEAIAKQFIDAGAEWLHIVDLDGAKDPSQSQTSLIANLIKSTGAKIQTGGGIRTKEQIDNLLTLGASRVIIGSAAITNQSEVIQWFKYFGPERLVLALDVHFNEQNQPYVAINAWRETSPSSLFDVIEYYQPAGLKHVLCTNIALDGTLNGPDMALYELLLAKYPFLNLQASGGVQSLSDIVKLKERQLSGAIIGRALYENKFTLSEVLSC